MTLSDREYNFLDYGDRAIQQPRTVVIEYGKNAIAQGNKVLLAYAPQGQPAKGSKTDPSGTKLTYDLRWFLLSELLFEPEIAMTSLEKNRNALKSRLPCLIGEFEGMDTRKTKKGHTAVRKKMQAIGFDFSKRPSKKFLERNVAGSKSKFVAVSTKAPKISVFVFTDPTPIGSKKVSHEECLRSNEKDSKLDCVACASRFEAQRLAGKKGVAIGITADAGIDEFWNKLDRATKGKQIAELFVFGHGFSGGMKIGGAELKESTSVPVSFQACRFSRNAIIHFFGCRVATGAPSKAKRFMQKIGKALLCRGGIVKGYEDFVESECSKQGGLKVRSDKAKLLSIPIAACDPNKTLEDFLKVLSQFEAKGEKVN